MSPPLPSYWLSSSLLVQYETRHTEVYRLVERDAVASTLLTNIDRGYVPSNTESRTLTTNVLDHHRSSELDNQLNDLWRELGVGLLVLVNTLGSLGTALCDLGNENGPHVLGHGVGNEVCYRQTLVPCGHRIANISRNEDLAGDGVLPRVSNAHTNKHTSRRDVVHFNLLSGWMHCSTLDRAVSSRAMPLARQFASPPASRTTGIGVGLQ